VSNAYEHVTVLLNEAVDALQIKPGGTYVDATFGRGGHSRRILEKLGSTGRLFAFDRDPQAIEAGRAIQDNRLHLVHAPFSRMAEELDGLQIGVVDGVLMDLGVSSPQLDDASRGMSFRFDAPLDMRMDPTCGESAAEWLARASVAEITNVLRDYGEERFAYAIAKAIDVARQGGDVATTGQLAQIVAATVRTREPGLHPATRTFQALRIYVNRELEELSLTLPQAVARLNAEGRLVVIAFHSLEDRIVKRFMRDHAKPPVLPKGLPVRESDRPSPALQVIGNAVRPSAQEVTGNARSRSAIMRVAVRTSAPFEWRRDAWHV